MSQNKSKSTKPDANLLAVDTITAARMLSLAPGTLENWRYTKDERRGPRWSRIGGKIVYPIEELKRYLAENMM